VRLVVRHAQQSNIASRKVEVGAFWACADWIRRRSFLLGISIRGKNYLVRDILLRTGIGRLVLAVAEVSQGAKPSAAPNRWGTEGACLTSLVQATAGRRVCGVLDVSPPPRLTTDVGLHRVCHEKLRNLCRARIRSVFWLLSAKALRQPGRFRHRFGLADTVSPERSVSVGSQLLW